MQIRNNCRNNRRDENLAMSLPQVWHRLCTRMGNMGTYRLLQINGQRKFFDPLDDSPPTNEGCEVFIGRIPRDMFEDELVPLFARCGPIHELRLMMNFSGTNRGFAFVTYKHPQYAEDAIKELNEFEVRPGQYIGVIQSVNNKRLYIGKLHPSGANENNLLKLLSTLTEGLQSLSLHAMKKMKVKSQRKYAIAVYVSHRHAAMARRFLILSKNEIFQEDVVVDWACPNIRGGKSNRSDHFTSSSENAKAETPKTSGAVQRNPLQALVAPRLKKPLLTPTGDVPEDNSEEEKKIRPIQLYGRFPKNSKFIANTGTKGLCYSRLTTPLYSLSPVPIPDNLLNLRPCPSLVTPLDFMANGKALRAPNPTDKGKSRSKDDKGKSHGKDSPQAVSRFIQMRPYTLAGPA